MSSSKPLPPPSASSLLSLSTVFPALVAARIALSLTSLPNFLKHDHQLASPLTSFPQLQEGIYLFNHDIDPYSGGTFRHSPLYLALFTTILPTNQKSCSLLWTLCDAIGAWALVQIWRRRQNVKNSARDSLIAAIYLLNPYIFLPSLALSTSSFDNTLILLSLMFATQGNKSATLLSLAFLINLSPFSILVLLPLLLVLVTDPFSHLASPRPIATGALKKVLPLVGEFLAYFLVLVLSASLMAGGFTWIPQTWGATVTLPDLTPNPGLWWYFFTEMFDHFRSFFLMTFSVHLLIYIVPICIKFQYDPFYAAFLLIGILGTFKAYPTLSDPGLFLSLISLFPETYPYMRFPIVTALLHVHASLLLPLFHHLWLTTGTGNANFFYASTLVFACANGAALLDCMWSALRVAIGQVPEDYAVVQE